MSRFATVGLVVLDTVASMASLVQSSLTLVAIAATLTLSCLLAVGSIAIHGLLNPTYFWDE